MWANSFAARPVSQPELNNRRIRIWQCVQVIDDTKGITLVSAGSTDKSLAEAVKGKTATEVAALVGKLIAERAVEKGISTVSFDRGGYLYHGRVKSLADAAREGGLKF